MIRASIGLVGITCALVAVAPQQTMTLSERLQFDVMELQTGADAGAFEAAAGAGGDLFRADRGNRRGQYVLVRREGRKAADLSRFLKTPVRQIEYRLIAPERTRPLPDVDVLGIHYIKVRPDRQEAFDRFVAEKLHPAVGRLKPDLQLLYYRSANASDADHYITIFALTQASRDKYWPKGSDSDDVRAAFAPVKSLTPELSTYLVEGAYLTGDNFAASVFESREWTDFVRVVPGGVR
jgi:hypothetical protein